MTQVLNLSTISLLGRVGKVYSGSAMATTIVISIQMQACGVWCSRELQQPKNPILHSGQLLGSATYGKRLLFSVQREPANSVHRGPPCCMSAEVGKEDNSSVKIEDNIEKDLAANPRLGLEEKFAVLYTGQCECRSCGYVYDQALGDPFYPIAPGIEFSKLPEDWRCPTCGAAKSYFNSKSVEVAGFTQNQRFGLGGNALTPGQKNVLIYGSLLFFFILFLSGYFLQ